MNNDGQQEVQEVREEYPQLYLDYDEIADDVKIPEKFECPVNCELMEDPVML